MLTGKVRSSADTASLPTVRVRLEAAAARGLRRLLAGAQEILRVGRRSGSRGGASPPAPLQLSHRDPGDSGAAQGPPHVWAWWELPRSGSRGWGSSPTLPVNESHSGQCDSWGGGITRVPEWGGLVPAPEPSMISSRRATLGGEGPHLVWAWWTIPASGRRGGARPRPPRSMNPSRPFGYWRQQVLRGGDPFVVPSRSPPLASSN